MGRKCHWILNTTESDFNASLSNLSGSSKLKINKLHINKKDHNSFCILSGHMRIIYLFIYLCVGTIQWFNTRRLSLLLSTSVLESESFTEPGTHYLAMPVVQGAPKVCLSLPGLLCRCRLLHLVFKWDLEI